MAIANPTQTLLRNCALASDLLLNKDGADLAYIENVTVADISSAEKVKSSDEKEDMPPVMQAVVKGRKEIILSLVDEKLKDNVEPQTIINDYLIPGINFVGKMFEEKKYFLPQLIASAETMKMAIHSLEPLIEKQRNGEKKETIIMATVKGDIHDIGKNLVALMLRNYGYNVIDMGKDVACEDIIRKAKETNASVIGLSALMTTTMMAMKDVVELAKKENVNAKIIIGGAVVTDSFASEINADGYSEDASEAVKLVSRLLQA
jgi:5-methyltetrahydrofolate--homocysteine methyltransferase